MATLLALSARDPTDQTVALKPSFASVERCSETILETFPGDPETLDECVRVAISTTLLIL